MIRIDTNFGKQNSSLQYEHGRNVIELYGIECLYHLTHINNLPSILANGLLSHNLAYTHYQNKITDISQQEVNARRKFKKPFAVKKCSLHDYVPTYFNSRNPMSYLLHHRGMTNDLVLLKINPDLLLQEDSLFTDGNASCNNTTFFQDLNDLDKIDWSCLNDKVWCHYDDGKRRRCAEALIPDLITPRNIMQIAVKNSNVLENILDLVSMDTQIAIQPELFF